ncbi:MAG TPA: hypothetical protein VLY23_07670 [Candidatus Acidoferrum sp.]|nr:hypothetical protein [Candidatus Acidoferrum sp.]
MIPGVHLEVVLAAGYVIFLAGVAFVLELLARHSHKRSERYRNSGFVYFHKTDLWECPEGSQLTRADVDYQRRIVYYRAPADACNVCCVKKNCTDSDDGRQLEKRLDSWLESELRRFHRGLSLALLVLATIILIAEAARHTAPRDLLIVFCLLLPVGFAETKLFASFLARQHDT